RHPVGLYQAVGMTVLVILLWMVGNPARPGRVTLMAVLGYSLLRLFTDGFVDNVALIGVFRRSQIVALLAALAAGVALARTAGGPAPRVEPPEPAPTPPLEDPQ